MASKNPLHTGLRSARIKFHDAWRGDPLNFGLIQQLEREVLEWEARAGVARWCYPSETSES